jgi:hypothetical protein
MPQTRPNGITVPINSDGYNLAPDLATMGDSANVITIAATQTARDALTLYPGRTVWRQDINALQTYNGAIWSTVYMAATPWTNISISAYGNGFNTTPAGGYNQIQYMVANNIVTISGSSSNASAWSAGNAILLLDASIRPTRKVQGANCAAEAGGNLLATVSGGAGSAIAISISYPLG